MSIMTMDEVSVKDYHDKLLSAVKMQVKAIMEESVTKKFVHEDSENVFRLCATVQTCLLDHLRKRTAGFLRSNKIANLFTKIGKSLPEVAQLVVKIEEAESVFESQLAQENKISSEMRPKSLQLKQIWVRLALTEKKLDKILEFLVKNSSKFYDKGAILSDPVRGGILSSLLVGPCALEYTKMKTSDHFWSDPPADELLQRHKLHSRNEAISPGRRPALQSISKYSSSDPTEKTTNGNSSGNAFREYVESLHQNAKSTLLYGKNNVAVQPRKEFNPIHGYLSLHQIVDSLVIKWSPNQLMKVNEEKKDADCNHDNEFDEVADQDNEGNRCALVPNGVVKSQENGQHQLSSSFFRRDHGSDKPKNLLAYWEYAFSVNVEDVVYLHCHQRNEAGGSLVLVGQDGVQRPPICFPPGGHLLAFLTCLEVGLLPRGHLDPPLRQQHGKGKVFPRLRKRSSHSSSSSASVGSQSEAEEATDFVFRVTTGKSNMIPREPVYEIDPLRESFDAYTIGPAYSCYKSQDSKSYSGRSSLKLLCRTMRRQIISRAFYGWLAHCRHLSTVRTHLSALVRPDPCQLPEEQVQPIDEDAWNSFQTDGKVNDREGLMRRVYFGGIKHSLRSLIWPYLLNHYPIDSTEAERQRIDSDCKTDYEKVLKEWRIAEKMIKSKERDLLVAKLSCDSRTSSTSSLDGPPKQYAIMMRKQSTMSDVFASLDHDTPVQANTTLEAVSDMNENKNCLEAVDRNEQSEFYPKKSHILSDHFVKDLRNANGHTPYSSISTEPSFHRHFSNLTTTSTSIDTMPFSMEEEPKLEHISEIEHEIPPSEQSCSQSDSESKSSSRKTPLVKQDGIYVADSISHGDSQELLDEVTGVQTSGEEALPEESPSNNLTSEMLENFSLNLHRIEKDVHRCDRNHEYFTLVANLDKLRNIMCSYVWRNLEIGYMQGMCDLCAPLMLVLDDESKVFSCFTRLMDRMGSNFPNGGAMDAHFANMRSLIQVLDAELFEHMHQKGDYTHFYFCYRWFLLDFKRELSYDNDVFLVWETIWAARVVCSEQFVLFFALSLLHSYRDIILDNEMDFTDIIKFFNEMAERHNATEILKLAQNFVYEVQSMISK